MSKFNLEKLKKLKYDLFKYAGVNPCKGTYAKSKNGNTVSVTSRNAVHCCSEGVLRRVFDGWYNNNFDLKNLIRQNHTSGHSLIVWNDNPRRSLVTIRKEMQKACRKAFA